MEQIYFDSLVILVCVINSIFHITGMYLLICLRYSAMNSSQRLFLLHLSLSEFCLTFMEMIKRILHISLNSQDNYILEYLNIIQFSSAAMVYYLIMIYLTADRFFELYLSIKYHLYWSETKSKGLLITTWVVFVMVTIVIFLLYIYKSLNYKKLFYIYIWPFIEIVFLVIACGTYGYIFRKIYKRNRTIHVFRAAKSKSGIGSVSIVTRKRNNRIFMQSAFYLPTVLILTFVLLQVVPDLAIFSVLLSGRNVPDHVFNIAFMTYMISILLDAVIYILLSPDVKRILIRKLISIKVMRQRGMILV